LAGTSPQEFVEAVRSAGDLVRLVSEHVPLKPAGSRLKGLCPFHEEKTPSFSVDPARQLFYCFGCEAGGDIFKFVMLYERVGFPEALESLATRFGVPRPQAARRSAGPLERLLEINAEAERFFRATLCEPQAGAPARAYLERRGIAPGTADALGLGQAPGGWDGLRTHLLARRFKPEELVAAGLTITRKGGGGEYDRFRERLIFPIRDVSGKPVAFGGRALGDEQPKYINSPETAAYRKGEHLYGLDRAREAIRRRGHAIVVEGYLDLAALVQAGFEHVVASLGTAFTAAQARLLSRFCNQVRFSYDGDAAGGAATARSLDLLLSRGFEVRVVELPGGLDPDEFIREHGAAAYGKLADEAPEYLEFLIRREARRRDPRRIEDKVAGVNAVLPHVSRLTDPVGRAAWAARLAEALGVDEEAVRQSLRGAVREAAPRIRQRAARRAPSQVECRLVNRLLTSAEERERLLHEVDAALPEDTQVRPIVRAIQALVERGAAVDHPAALAELADEADQELLTWIAFRDEPEAGPSVEDCLWTLRKERLARESRLETQQIQEGWRAGADVDQRLTRALEIARQRDALS